jgi:hypothetical protein
MTIIRNLTIETHPTFGWLFIVEEGVGTLQVAWILLTWEYDQHQHQETSTSDH